ncbi:hypothetical protein FHW23_001766 [Curtobacterium pusillum]|uniref:Uncharacterized protein n=1 Tax=Curtobacterium pusillum TaxID=69373 RepID=A0AAW3T721_9MICO|nr:hypothetical protein [Curtobacterium pusillum]MBA8990520.1 hypothetical protein [Curtobacterium pusillum]
MSPFLARCLLVVAAIVLLSAGVVGPVAGASRAVLIGAAGWCAVLDLLLVRATRRAETDTDADVVVLRPGASTEPASGQASRSPWGQGTDAAPGPRDDHDPTGPPSTVVLGTGRDGSAIGLGHGAPAHIVVVGAGVLAVAVFRAVAAQVRARGVASGDGIRVGSAPDLRSVVASGSEHCPPLPDGTAALVTDPGDGDAPTTVVLVPGLGQMPRRWDVAVEVTRYGCSVRRPNEPQGTPVSPALPQLGERA